MCYSFLPIPTLDRRTKLALYQNGGFVANLIVFLIRNSESLGQSVKDLSIVVTTYFEAGNIGNIGKKRRVTLPDSILVYWFGLSIVHGKVLIAKNKNNYLLLKRKIIVDAGRESD